jgi:DnaJ-class molecular chaperone
MTLDDALRLFKRLGVNVPSLSRWEFKAAYYGLARRYHPDMNPSGNELMAHINAARSTIINSRLLGCVTIVIDLFSLSGCAL